jgi:hypothetical protein
MPRLPSSLRLPIAIGMLSLSASPAAFSQKPASPKITVAPLPGQMVWTVNFTYEKTRESLVKEVNDAVESAPVSAVDLERPTQMTYTIKKPVSSRVTTYEGGGKDEAYQLEGYEFEKSRRNKDVIKHDLRDHPTPEQLFLKKFPGVHWVKPKLFVRIENAFGESCAYFHESASVLTAEQLQREDLNVTRNGEREAWFSMTTGMPVAFKEDGATGKFKFGAPSSAEVSIPKDIRVKLTEFVKHMNYLKLRDAPEGAVR